MSIQPKIETNGLDPSEKTEREWVIGKYGWYPEEKKVKTSLSETELREQLFARSLLEHGLCCFSYDIESQVADVLVDFLKRFCMVSDSQKLNKAQLWVKNDKAINELRILCAVGDEQFDLWGLSFGERFHFREQVVRFSIQYDIWKTPITIVAEQLGLKV